jgi:hypothetical protein
MGNIIRYAVLQMEPDALTADPLKRAFKSFSHLTDADAVRLALGAHGILMRHLRQADARALQSALRAEGLGVTMVAETDLPKLPEAQLLHRLELWPQALTVYDPFGRPTAIAWPAVHLVAAAAAPCFEVNKKQTEHTRLQLDTSAGVRPKKADDAGRKTESESQLLLEILLADSAALYQIDAAEFTFKYVIDRPGLSIEEKFIWLVREICHHAPQAVLNAGARDLREGRNTAPVYISRTALMDEMIWLLWQNAQQKRFHSQ